MDRVANPPWIFNQVWAAHFVDFSSSHFRLLAGRAFFSFALKIVSPGLSPFRFSLVIAGVDGDVVRGVTASPPVNWADLSAANLFDRLRFPFIAGVSFISARF